MAEFTQVVPILRILSEDTAREFYLDYLGFEILFEHRFAENMPLYIGIRRGDVVLHLSEHSGDGYPVTAVRIRVDGLAEYRAELTAKKLRYVLPEIEVAPWKAREMNIFDPFGNMLRFNEPFA